MTASDPVTRHQSNAVARVQLELAVGSEPISGYIQDDTGRHEFVGWIDLVDAIAKAHETGDAHGARVYETGGSWNGAAWIRPASGGRLS